MLETKVELLLIIQKKQYTNVKKQQNALPHLSILNIKMFFFSRQHNGVCSFQTRVSGFHFSLDRPEALCFVDFEVESPCFFLDAAGSTNGPDQV